VPDVTYSFSFRGRTTYRLNLRRAHLPSTMQKLLNKLEDATTTRTDAEEARRTCGHGTGPERSKFDKEVARAEAVQLDAYDNLVGAAARNRSALVTSTADAYEGALERAAKAEREYLDALEEAADAASLHALARSPLAVLDVDERSVARKNAARNAVLLAASTIRQLNLPGLDD
jgi:hypothetical protein